MTTLIVLLIICGIVFFINKLNKSKDSINSSATMASCSTVNIKKDSFKEFSLKGISYRNLNKRDIGQFQGYAIAETNNPHDPYAVAIYRNDGKHLGYAPSNYMTLSEYIISKGGRVKAFGEINKSEDGYYFGRVNIEFNQNYWHDITPPDQRIYVSPNLKRYAMEKLIPDTSIKKGRFFGYGILNETVSCDFAIDIFSNEGSLIGRVDDQEYLFNTIKEYDGGKVDVWGYFVEDINKYDNKKAFDAFVYIPAKCTAKKIAKEKEKFINEKISFTFQH